MWLILDAIDQQGNEWTYVLHRSNDKDYKQFGSPLLFVYKNNELKKVFVSRSINIQFKWEAQDHIPPILPGAMASIFSDRSLIMPKLLLVRAEDDNDFVQLKMSVQTKSEIIVPDNLHKQYSFIKELTGTVATNQWIDAKKTTYKKGFFYAENVH